MKKAATEKTPWDGRRNNKRKERFPADDQEPVFGAALISPVQPSNAASRFGDVDVRI